MALAYQILAQHIIAVIDTLEVLYTVPGATEGIVSSITVCNTDTVAHTFRIRVAPAGAADATEHALYHDVTVPGNDTFIATVGLTLAATDVIRVESDSLLVTFHAYGTEET